MPRTPGLNFRNVPSPREIEWTRILDRWKQSGLGGPTFCRREGLSQPLFYSWKRKLRLRQEAKTATPRPRRRGLQFVPVEVKPVPSVAPLELALDGGRVVRIPSGFDAAALTRLLTVLEGRAC